MPRCYICDKQKQNLVRKEYTGYVYRNGKTTEYSFHANTCLECLDKKQPSKHEKFNLEECRNTVPEGYYWGW